MNKKEFKLLIENWKVIVEADRKNSIPIEKLFSFLFFLSESYYSDNEFFELFKDVIGKPFDNYFFAFHLDDIKECVDQLDVKFNINNAKPDILMQSFIDVIKFIANNGKDSLLNSLNDNLSKDSFSEVINIFDDIIDDIYFTHNLEDEVDFDQFLNSLMSKKRKRVNKTEDGSQLDKITFRKKLNKNDRVTYTTTIFNWDKMKSISQDEGFNMKPKGLWYAFGEEWEEFCNINNFNIDKYRYKFLLIIDDSKIYKIKNNQDLKEFEEKYYIKDESGLDGIDWKSVENDGYFGFEIKNWNSLSGKYNIDMGSSWISKYDLDSGCIWNINAIKDVKPLLFRSVISPYKIKSR